MFDELYQELVFEHAKSRHNRGELDEGLKCTLKNPLCGDEICLCACFEENQLAELKFNGEGCLISQAASSLLIDIAKRKSIPELREILTAYKDLLSAEQKSVPEQMLGELVMLAGVSKFPSRVRCALLAAEALERVLDERERALASTLS